MIKAGDLVGWSEHFRGERPGLDELDDFGVVVSIHNRLLGLGFPKSERIRIAWFKDPDESIDEYPLSWASDEMRKGGLFILSQS
jgi:hypothetical protein